MYIRFSGIFQVIRFSLKIIRLTRFFKFYVRRLRLGILDAIVDSRVSFDPQLRSRQ